MKRIKRENATVCTVSSSIEPAITVAPGESFLLETEDAAGGYFTDDSVLPYPEKRPTHKADPPLLNPLAGPVCIEGVEPGDTVAVTIESIEPDDHGYTILQPEDGLFGDSLKYRELTDHYTKILKHEPGASGSFADGFCRYSDTISWRLSPHIGTLCLAPDREALASVSMQGPFGGNVDSRDVAQGATVFLRSHNHGGLLFAGDVHAGMGDGEITDAADECASVLRLRCDVIKGKTLPHIRIKTADGRIVALFCDKPLESAIRGASANLMDWLVADYGLEQRDAYVIMGTCTGFRIHVYQMVDFPGLSYTVGVSLPETLVMK